MPLKAAQLSQPFCAAQLLFTSKHLSGLPGFCLTKGNLFAHGPIGPHANHRHVTHEHHHHDAHSRTCFFTQSEQPNRQRKHTGNAEQQCTREIEGVGTQRANTNTDQGENNERLCRDVARREQHDANQRPDAAMQKGNQPVPLNPDRIQYRRRRQSRIGATHQNSCCQCTAQQHQPDSQRDRIDDLPQHSSHNYTDGGTTRNGRGPDGGMLPHLLVFQQVFKRYASDV